MNVFQLLELRHRIDDVDGQLIRLLSSRETLSKAAQQIKRDAGLPVEDTERERIIFERAYRIGGHYVERVFHSILAEVKR